ncbi:hypothetical protein BD410DRAFT_470005 [Rickenella mellea]|uniref:RNI-like protein n=1 Tax=Rickenella mellea TaxID=50990 RepID=A0A4Y7QGK9_9AGAM|nr:hypothetical protein BD410DRAFT_470005 [Rickenella mellea]
MILSRFPNVPLLETLEIQVRGNYVKELITIDLSEPLPLSALYLIDFPTHFHFSDAMQNNLRNIGGRNGMLYLTLNDCFQCLVHCPFIEEFKVVTVDDLHTNLPTAMIELPNIKLFEISCPRGGDISSLFNALYLPAMENFEFLASSASSPLQCPWSSIARMLPQSPKLRILTIHTAPVVAEDLVKCLANTPGLQYLDLQNILNGNGIISLLTLHRLSGGMVDGLTPKLKRILLDFTSHTDQISTTAVAEMILSRCQSDADDTYVDESTVGGAHSQTGIHPTSQQTLEDVRLGSISEFTAESLTTQFPELVDTVTQVEIMIENDTRNCGRLLFL